jgi:hypothetical protein
LGRVEGQLRMTRLPQFLVIGAMRAGTTTLYRDLQLHPAIFLPEEKEPNVLIEAGTVAARRARYDRLFRLAADHQICGDASTNYAKQPDISGIPERARETVGAAIKLIYLTRDPIRRIVSQHHYETGMRLVTEPIDQAIRNHPRYIDFSRYAMQIEPWLTMFGRSNVMVVPFEQYVLDRPTTVAEICRFLDIDPTALAIPTDRSFNQAADLPVNTPAWRRLVFHRSWYRYYVKPLLPREVRERAARILLPRAPSVPETPSSASVAWLCSELTNDVRLLRDLFPEINFPWSDFPIANEKPASEKATATSAKDVKTSSSFFEPLPVALSDSWSYRNGTI